MVLIYLTSLRDRWNTGNICVQTEIMENRCEPIVIYRSYKCSSHTFAKVKALTDVLSRFQFSKDESVTIFTDDEKIAAEWENILSGSAPKSMAWAKLTAELFRFTLCPQLRKRGCLTVAMKSDLTKYLSQQRIYEKR